MPEAEEEEVMTRNNSGDGGQVEERPGRELPGPDHQIVDSPERALPLVVDLLGNLVYSRNKP